MNTKQLLDEIRKLISRCTDSEKGMLEELCVEAEGWEMRLQELESEKTDDS